GAGVREREAVVGSLLARTVFKVGRDLGPPELIEAVGGAPEISRRVDRRVIGADQGDDIAGERRLWTREALFNSDKCEIYRAIEQPDRAARRTRPRHRHREWIHVFLRASRCMKPTLSRRASDDRNIVRDVNPLRYYPSHLNLLIPSARPQSSCRV